MWLTDTAVWCRWRRWESIHGIIRAELTLVPVADGGRRIPIPGKGVLRPLWHIGQNMPDGHSVVTPSGQSSPLSDTDR
jgi:hypothetical protein